MSTPRKDGGPAFPYAFQHEDDSRFTSGGISFGMSLRDWFAGQALAGLCANPGGPFQPNSMSGWGLVNCTHADVVGLSLHLADAMLAARKGGTP